MNVLTIVAIGLIATGYMFGVQWLAERLGLVRGSLIRAVGAFVIPEPVRSPATGILLHLVAGVVFTAVYAYVFNFVHMDGMLGFIELGALIGLVHGFFVSYFSMTGFSSLERGGEMKRFTFASAALNVLAHVVFGVIVGTGFAFALVKGTVTWFFLYGLAGLVVINGLALLMAPRGPRRYRPAEPTGRAS